MTEEPDVIRKAIEAIYPLTDDIPEPDDSDWLASHEEKGQTFNQFRNSLKNVYGGQRNVIYI